MSHGCLTCKVFSECCLQNVIYPEKTIQECMRSGAVFGLNLCINSQATSMLLRFTFSSASRNTASASVVRIFVGSA